MALWATFGTGCPNYYPGYICTLDMVYSTELLILYYWRPKQSAQLVRDASEKVVVICFIALEILLH
jgi:hypothetical protein